VGVGFPFLSFLHPLFFDSHGVILATCDFGLVIDGAARGLKFRQIKHHGEPFDFGSRIPW
jgi:hypothetical protein